MTDKVLCLYHKNCMDGFVAAWAVGKHYGFDNVEFVEAKYGSKLPDLTGRDVVIVDFSYKPEVLKRWFPVVKSLVMLDHHLSAQEDWNSQLDVSNFLTNITIIFENNESGASMAWRYFNKNVEMPLIVKRARDYDLWHHHDIDTVPLIAALWASDRFKEQDFTLIDDMLDEEKYAEMLKLGTIIEKEKNNLIQSMIATGNHRFVKVSPEISIPVMHVSSTLANHSGTHLNKVAMQRFQEQLFTSQDIEALREVGGLFSATYTENWEEKRRTFSLRSNSKYEYSMDVTTVARRFGGGGHKNSSGFSVPIQVPVHRLFNQGFLAQLHTKFLVWFYTKVNKK